MSDYLVCEKGWELGLRETLGIWIGRLLCFFRCMGSMGIPCCVLMNGNYLSMFCLLCCLVWFSYHCSEAAASFGVERCKEVLESAEA